LNKVAENEENGAGREEMRTGEACGRIGGDEAARLGDDRGVRAASESFDKKTLALQRSWEKKQNRKKSGPPLFR
jgi:hypothetical protein